MPQNKPSAERPPAYLIESVDHALHVLQLVTSEKRIRVTDVAQRLGVAKSTAHRLLMTLAWRGFVTQERDGKGYRAGRMLYEIGFGAAESVELRRVARRHMETLAAQCHETVNLIILEGGSCRFIDGVEGGYQLRIGLRTGNLLPAYASSGGKALLADLDPDEVAALYSGQLGGLTEKTLSSLSELKHELERVRMEGYALNVEESEEGVGAISAPIIGPHGSAVAALAIALPVLRMTRQRMPQLIDGVQRTAHAISEDL